MKVFTRKYCGNLGGIAHITGNLCLLTKGLIAAMFAGQILDFTPLLIQWPATLSGFIFVVAAGMLALYGHRAKGFIIGNVMALVGYLILAGQAVSLGSVLMVMGLAIGMGSSLYALLVALQVNFRFLSVNTRYLNRRVKKMVTDSLERFPFWPSGVIEFISDTALLAGAIMTGDGAMMLIASLWAVGSVFIGSAAPALAAVKS